jgi:hypothetical protein
MRKAKFVVAVVLLVLLFAAGVTSVRAQAITDTSVFTLLTRGYSILRIDPPSAIPYFKRAAELEPNNYQAQAMLGFLYHSQKDMKNALKAFEQADRLQPSDSLKLQIAYCHIALGDESEGKSVFQRLTSSPYPDVRQRASEQLAAMASGTGSAGAPAEPSWTRLYSAMYYDTRWESAFIALTAEQGYDFNAWLSAYGFLGLSFDTKSSAGTLPQIFSDNAMLLGVGLRAAPFTGFSVSAQQGASFDIIGRKEIDFVREDFRFVLNYGWGIYAPFSLHDGARFPLLPVVDIYSSMGAYSKYKNTIGYLQIKGGLRVLEVSKTTANVYAKLNFARDWAVNILRSDASIKPKEYYNNINEWGAGIRVTPNVDWGIYVDLEASRGMYSHRSLLPSAREQYYSGWRLYLIVDRMFRP